MEKEKYVYIVHDTFYCPSVFSTLKKAKAFCKLLDEDYKFGKTFISGKEVVTPVYYEELRFTNTWIRKTIIDSDLQE